MKTKIYNLGKVKLTMESNGFPKGLILKRDLTVRECRYILYALLGINIATKDDLDDEEYREQNEEYVQTVNAWLRGETDDSAIMEFAYDCSDEPLGLMNMIPIVAYLQKKGIYEYADHPQRPAECKYYYQQGGGWTHWCVNLNAPCRLFHGYHCPDFAPKTEKKD